MGELHVLILEMKIQNESTAQWSHSNAQRSFCGSENEFVLQGDAQDVPSPFTNPSTRTDAYRRMQNKMQPKHVKQKSQG